MPPCHVNIVIVFSVATGIDDVQPTGSLKAYIQNGVLHVSGLKAGATWTVYNILGAIVYQDIATGDTAEVLLPGKGMFIVASEKAAVKVIE
jgi:hypothetical protein